MTKRKNPAIGRPQTVHTIESLIARCEEVGECVEWQGYADNDVPQVSHGGKLVSVRRLILDLGGIAVRDGSFASCSCGNKRCVKPEHIVQRTRLQHLQKMNAIGPNNTGARVAKLSMHARKRSKLTIEKVRELRMSGESSMTLSKQYGVSRQTISRIRAGDVWKELSSPFAGLGAR